MYHRVQVEDSVFIQVFNLPPKVANHSSIVDDKNYFHILGPGADARGWYVEKTKSCVSRRFTL